MDRIHTPARLRLSGRLDTEAAYIVAGSFVGYLIEQHGMAKFRQLYALSPLIPGNRHAGGASTRWESVYDVSLESLATSWRRFIQP